MFKVHSPLSRQLVEWALGRGFRLWDWSELPIVADAVQDALGDEAREQLLDHGRWLVLVQMQGLCRPLWTYPGGAWDFKPMSAWSAGKLGQAIRSFCGPRKPHTTVTFDAQARAILDAIRDRPAKAKDLFRDASGQTHVEMLLVRNLLEQFLACAAYRPRKAAP
jgi:hypothetical protein